MIMETVTFFAIFFIGGSVWFLLAYILDILFNWYAVYYPVYAAYPSTVFLVAAVDWGMFLICMLPAAIYLWTNTQRPEAM